MKLFINICVFVGMANLLNYLGYTVLTWQFWVIMGGLLISLVNNGINEKSIINLLTGGG